MDICEYSKKLWELYMFADSAQDVRKLLDSMDENITIIGTGKHEFYEKLSEFAKALEMEGPEREEIEFRIQSVTAREKPVCDGVKLVVGELHVIGAGRHMEVAVDMDTRYTMVYKRAGGRERTEAQAGEPEWKLIHIHQSLPYVDQQEGEYYPKTLMAQVDEANQRAAYLERLAAIDRLTGILNHSAFFEKSESLSQEKGGGFCMTIDLDDFKGINDTYGHLAGDEVLREMGRILRYVTGDLGVAGRVGGDEFAVYLGEIASEEEACSVAEEIMRQTEACGGEGKACWSLSIGISRLREGEGLKDAIRRADDMLYEVKRSGKHGYRFCE